MLPAISRILSDYHVDKPKQSEKTADYRYPNRLNLPDFITGIIFAISQKA
jgi:hypothetical protein